MTDETQTRQQALIVALGRSADWLRAEFPDATIVILGSIESGIHSYPGYAWRGACVPTIGLLDVGTNMVREGMPETYRRRAT